MVRSPPKAGVSNHEAEIFIAFSTPYAAAPLVRDAALNFCGSCPRRVTLTTGFDCR